jgi:hypothetical protein
MNVNDANLEALAAQHGHRGSQSSKRIENGKLIEESSKVVGVKEITDEGEHYFQAGRNDKFAAQMSANYPAGPYLKPRKRESVNEM